MQVQSADGRIWIDVRAAATPMPKAFSLGGFLTLVDLTKHFAVRCRPQQIANALWSFAVLMFQPLNCAVAFSNMEICQWMRIWQGACTRADIFGHRDSTDWHFWKPTANQQLGQGQLIFCLCFAGGQSTKKKCVLPKGARRSGRIWPSLFDSSLRISFAGWQWNALALLSHRMCPIAFGHWLR